MISLLGSEGGDLGHLRPKSPRVPSAPPPSIRASSLLSLPRAPSLWRQHPGVGRPPRLLRPARPSPRVHSSPAGTQDPSTPRVGFCSSGVDGVGVAGRAGWTVQRSEEGAVRGRGCGRTKSCKMRGLPSQS